MKPECKSDCAPALGFPRPIDNRPGLSHIDYRIGTYTDFREALLCRLNRDDLLRSWSHREPDDPGIALLEGAAVLGDILTFYQEQYANEAYLRTARWRESVADLVRLLGYRLAPGVGGRATFAFEVRGDAPVAVPKGFPLRAQVTGAEGTVNFATEEPVLAVPALSRFHLFRPAHLPTFAAEVSKFSVDTAALQKANVTIEAQDRLMLLDTDRTPTNRAQIVLVKKVEEEFARTNITIEGRWKAEARQSGVKAYKLGQTFRHFGHNAPPEVGTVDATGNPSQRDITYDRKLHAITKTTRA
ncbi:MAG: hypothetical protein GY953_00800, partial [bacterium]|nr:hypothetical protein [bacterium]